MPRRPSLVKGVVLEPLPNGVYRVELENGAKVLAHVADRAGTHFTRLLAGDKVGVELAETDRSRGRIREIRRRRFVRWSERCVIAARSSSGTALSA
ncbi:MAG: translation initiation factor IF-1 [Chloroflexi bacterium]|nr:MAG: translation initiation factor IF-1 [Chloroflexota bacterium]